jgi:predicted phage terminase large subunit-like protein
LGEAAAKVFSVELHAGQVAIYNSPARFRVCAAGRRFGKSHFAAVKLAEEGLRTTKDWVDADGNRRVYQLTQEHGVYYVAPTFDQAKRIMWPKLFELLGHAKTGGLIDNFNINDGWIQLVGSGRKIYIKGADNPDSLRGIALSFVVLDEFADMKPDTWDTILEPALMDVKGDALFIGTPKGKNHFYKLFMAALHHGRQGDDPKPDWADWEAFHFKSLDNPFLDAREVKRMMNTSNRPSHVIRQEIEADFVSGSGAVLKRDWFPVVKNVHGFMPAATTRIGTNHAVPTADRFDGHVYVTVDLAGFVKESGNKRIRSDETVIATTYVTTDAWYILDIQHGHWDARETALRIIRTCAARPSCRLGIEKGALANAIGPYLEDEMRRWNRFVTPEPLSHGGTRKIDRITGALQGRGERGRVVLIEGGWNEAFLEQCDDFPDPLAHDDLLDAVAYVDQMATPFYHGAHEMDEWQPQDLDAGY